MATSFGELRLVTSRAVDDEEDDEDLVNEKKCPEIFYEGKIREVVDSVNGINIIAVGPIACGFCRAYIFGNEVSRVGTIFSRRFADQDDENTNQPQTDTIVCEVYRKLDQPTSFFLIVAVIQDDIVFDLTQQIFSLVRPDSTSFVLCNEHISRFYSAQWNQPVDENQLPLTRCLKSSNYSRHIPCSYLNQPNIISGIAAGLTTHCEVYSKPCLLFISYTDLMQVDSVNVNAFLPILRCAGLRQAVNSKLNLQQYATSVHTSNLYL